MIFNEINYADLKFNKYVAKLFQQNIAHLESKFNENLSKGFIEDPLLKCFSLWLSNYMLTNLTIEESKREDQKFDNMKDTYTTTSKILGEVFADIEHTDLNHMISIVAKVASRCIGFSDEIRAQKWIYLGLEVSIIPQCYAERFRYLFYDIDFFLIQALFILTENPKQLFRDFLEGYSVDSTLNNAFTNMLFAGDETSFEFGNQSDKEVSCIKNFLYFINQLMTDDRSVLYKWMDQQHFIEYPHKDIIKAATEKYMDKVSSNEAIHALVRHSGTNIKNILSKSEKHLFEFKNYEEHIVKFARMNKNREGISIFSLDPKYISHYNPFFFNDINSYIEGIKNYDEYYKSKVKDSDEEKQAKYNPLKIGNSGMGFYLAMLREAVMRTDIVKILLFMLENRKVQSFIDNEVEEFVAHILTILIDYAIEQEHNYADELTLHDFQTTLEAKKSLFESLEKEPHFKQLEKSYKTLMKTQTEDKDEEEKEGESQKKKKIDKKKRAEMMRKKALDKINKKRNKIAKDISMSSETASNCDTSSVMSGQESSAPQCQKCFEPLTSEDFNDNPYGYL